MNDDIHIKSILIFPAVKAPKRKFKVLLWFFTGEDTSGTHTHNATVHLHPLLFLSGSQFWSPSPHAPAVDAPSWFQETHRKWSHTHHHPWERALLPVASWLYSHRDAWSRGGHRWWTYPEPCHRFCWGSPFQSHPSHDTPFCCTLSPASLSPFGRSRWVRCRCWWCSGTRPRTVPPGCAHSRTPSSESARLYYCAVLDWLDCVRHCSFTASRNVVLRFPCNASPSTHSNHIRLPTSSPLLNVILIPRTSTIY